VKVSPFSVNCDSLGSVSKLRTCNEWSELASLEAALALINHLVPEMPESVARCIGRILNDTREINGGSLPGEVNMVESRESRVEWRHIRAERGSHKLVTSGKTEN
jgi:hypothetical protein